MRSKVPGMFIRLSNLMIIQVVFIFAALALVLFYPRDPSGEHKVAEDAAGLKDRLVKIGSLVSRELPKSYENSISSESSEKWKVRVSRLLAVEPSLDYAALVVRDDSSEFRTWYAYVAGEEKDVEEALGQVFLTYCDYDMLQATASQEPGFLVECVFGSKHAVCYNRLAGPTATPAVLVTVVDHGLVVSPRSALQYTVMILFLAATLISLLILHLISKRVKQPLDRLIRGLEKTAEGELYYMIEPESDSSLNRLVNSFNRMTQKLWDNQKQLKEYNVKLKKSNISILESQVFLATLIDCSPFSIVVVNVSGQIMIFNQAATDVFAYTSEEVVGRTMDVLLGQKSDQPNIRKDQEQKVGVEVICRRKDGEHFPAYMVSTPVATGTNDFRAWLYIIRDISESKSFQEMMVSLDRYYTRGEMAGDIAHEINNYLAVLMGNLELLPLLFKKGNTDKIEAKLDLMKSTVDRIAQFANGLMDTPQDNVHFEPVSINQLVENIIAFLKPQNRFDNIRIIATLCTDLAVVELDSGQVQQLLVNLVYNASEVLSEQEGDKIIRVSTSVGTLDGKPCAQIEVADNGPGVPAEKEELLFNERFTTKRKGHGIGLITCSRIMNNHSGKIDYRNEGGAVFSLLFPLERLKAVVEEPSSEPTRAPVQTS